MPRRRPDAAALAVVGAGTLLALARRVVAVPPFLPAGTYPDYSASTPRAEILLAPVMHAPWFGQVGLPIAIVVSVAVLACLWLASRRLAAGAGPAAVAVFAAAARPEFATALALAAAPVTAVALIWIAVTAAAVPAGTWPTAALAASAAAAAACTWPPIIVLAPIVMAAEASVRQWRALNFVVLGTAAGLVGGAAVWAARAGAMAGEIVAVRDVFTVAAMAAPAGDVPYPWPPLTAMLLPAALAVAGALVIWRRARGRVVWVVSVGVIVAVVVAAPAWRLEFQRAITWSAWPLVAAGLSWLVDRTSQRRRSAALAASALVLIGSAWLDRVRPSAVVEPRAFAASLAAALPSPDAGLTVVAENPRVDTALVAWGGASLRRVRPTADAVEGAAAGGSTVLAGPTARAALELWGLRFTAGPTVWATVPFEFARVAGGFHCVDIGARWSELPGLDYTGRLGAHLPPGAGHLEVVVVGAAPVEVRVTSADGRTRGDVSTAAVHDLAALPPVLWPGDGRLPPDGTALARAVVTALAEAPVDVAIALGARSPLTAARMVGGGTATVCAAPLPRPDPLERLAAGASFRVPLDGEAYVGAGWRPLARQRRDDARETDGRGVILIPSSGARVVTIAVEVAINDASRGTAQHVAVAVNGTPVTRREVSASGVTVHAIVPTTLWIDGTNEIALTLDPGPLDSAAERPRLVVRSITLTSG